VIKRGEEVLMLIECKTAGADLAREHGSQLLRYFHVTQARVGVLTNGITYRFYSDLDEPNKMDTRPFLEFDLNRIDEGTIGELKQLSKAHFNVDELVGKARDLKDLKALRQEIAKEFEAPSEELVRLLAGRVYDGRFTSAAKEHYASLTKRALALHVSDRVSSRLQNAIEAETASAPPPPSPEPLAPSSDIETTEDEMEGFRIVRAILRSVVSADRVVHRDVKSYFGILLDDNNRKPICRLHFNTSQRYIEVFDVDGGERHPIESLDDIYSFSDRLRAAATRYDEA